MSDYSFMKSGGGDLITHNMSETEKVKIASLLITFMKYAMRTAAEYTSHCNRKGITPTDISYALKHEVFQFIKRPSVIEEAQQEMELLTADMHRYEEYDGSDDSCVCEAASDAAHDECSDCVNDEAIEAAIEVAASEVAAIEVAAIEAAAIEACNDCMLEIEKEQFVRSTCICALCKDINSTYDNWNNWVPTNSMELVLKKNIDEINLS